MLFIAQLFERTACNTASVYMWMPTLRQRSRERPGKETVPAPFAMSHVRSAFMLRSPLSIETLRFPFIRCSQLEYACKRIEGDGEIRRASRNKIVS